MESSYQEEREISTSSESFHDDLISDVDTLLHSSVAYHALQTVHNMYSVNLQFESNQEAMLVSVCCHHSSDIPTRFQVQQKFQSCQKYHNGSQKGTLQGSSLWCKKYPCGVGKHSMMLKFSNKREQYVKRIIDGTDWDSFVNEFSHDIQATPRLSVGINHRLLLLGPVHLFISLKYKECYEKYQIYPAWHDNRSTTCGGELDRNRDSYLCYVWHS